MKDYPNQEILAKIALFSQTKKTITQADIELLLKEHFNISLTISGYLTFIRQTYTYLRKTQSHKQATVFKAKVTLDNLIDKENLE